jgi:ABC-type amino acid transport substrate-binding protein
VEGTTGDLFITKSINGATIRRFTTSKKAVAALVDEKIDVRVYDAPMICHYAAVNEQRKLTPILDLATEEYLAWGIAKGNQKLYGQANSFLIQLKQNGQLSQLIRKWIPYMQSSGDSDGQPLLN